MLPIDKSLELYGLIKPHLPEVDEGVEFVAFIRAVIDSMRETDFVDYVMSVQLLHGLELDEVLEMESQDIFIAFLEGLSKNKIFVLVRFCESLGL